MNGVRRRPVAPLNVEDAAATPGGRGEDAPGVSRSVLAEIGAQVGHVSGVWVCAQGADGRYNPVVSKQADVAEAWDRSKPTAPQSLGTARGEVGDSVLGDVESIRRLHLREQEASSGEALGVLGRADMDGVKGLAANDTVFIVAAWEVLGHIAKRVN